MQVLPKIVMDLVSRNEEAFRKAMDDLREGKQSATVTTEKGTKVEIKEVKPTG
jgi:hypothetical protein